MVIPGAEEIAVKLNIDVTDAEKMRRSLTDAGKEGHSSFLHADSAAKGFRKTLHELSDQIPILGYGLRALISPIGAAFALAATGIGYATKALEDFNKKLDETGKLNAQPITTGRPQTGWQKFFRREEEKEKGGVLGQPGNEEAADKIADARKKNQDLRNSIQTEIDRLEKEKLNLDEREEKKTEAGNQWSIFMAGMTGKPMPPQAPRRNAEISDELRRLKDQQSHVEDQGLLLESANKKFSSPQPLGLLQGLGISNIMSAYLQSAAPAVRMADYQNWLKVQPQYDEATGGYAYRGLDYHGIDYKPLRGAPGWGAAATRQQPEQISIQQLTREVLVAVKSQLAGDGIIVTGKE